MNARLTACVLESDGKVHQIPTRHVHYDVPHLGLPKCAWCKIRPLQPVSDFVQYGFTCNLISTVCFCEACCMGTVVQYEIQTGNSDISF